MDIVYARRQEQGVMSSFLKVDGNLFFLESDMRAGIDEIPKEMAGSGGLVAIAYLQP